MRLRHTTVPFTRTQVLYVSTQLFAAKVQTISLTHILILAHAQIYDLGIIYTQGCFKLCWGAGMTLFCVCVCVLVALSSPSKLSVVDRRGQSHKAGGWGLGHDGLTSGIEQDTLLKKPDTVQLLHGFVT